MKSDDSSAFEFWVVVENRGKHSTDCVPESCVEVIQNYFRSMTAILGSILVIQMLFKCQTYSTINSKAQTLMSLQ